MKHKHHKFLAAILGILVNFGACASEANTRSHLLRQTPIGTTFDKVWEYCQSRKLKCYKSTTAGYLNQKTGKTVGVSSIWAVVKERKPTPLTAESTSAYWGFGTDNLLIDVWVWKTIDAP
jgi:hypothetical protein